MGNGIPVCRCAPPRVIAGAALEFEFLGNLDDDAAVWLNGKPITGHLELWDYQTNRWRDAWYVYNFTDGPSVLPYPTGTYQPVTSDMARRAGWWGAWSNPMGERFYKLRYTGPLSPLDKISVFVVNIIVSYTLRPWVARLLVGGETVREWMGGHAENGSASTGNYIDLTPPVIPPGRQFLHYYPLGDFFIPDYAPPRANGITACCLNDFAADDTPPVPPVPPPVPRLDITAVPDGVAQAVYLSWRVEDPSETVNDDTLTEYRIYRDGNLIATVSGQELPDNSPPWGDLGYIVQAYTADGVWRLTGSVMVKLAAVLPPYYPALPAPDTVTATADNGQQLITVSWSEVFAAASYNVLRATNPDGPYTPLANTTALTVSDPAIQRGVTYYYKVQTVSEPASTDEPPLSNWTQAELYRVVIGLLAEQVETYYDDGEPYTAPLRLTDEEDYRLVAEASDI